VNYGTAGGVSARAVGLHEVGEVLQRDMMAEPLAPRGQTPFDDTPVRLRSTSADPQALVCATGDSFVSSTDPWLHAQGVDLVDMELWGIAMACRRLGVAWRAWKYVSDNANEHSHSNARWHLQPLFGPDWGVGVMTHCQSSDMCVYSTILY
jgi:adenosylhomocysteine nucleosidase